MFGVVLTVGLMASACSSGDGDGDTAPVNSVAPAESTSSTTSTTTTTTSTPTTTTTEPEVEPTETTPPTAENATEEEALVAAIERFWGNIWAVSNPPDPDPARWDGIATGAYVDELTGRTAARVENGTALVARNPAGPFVLSVGVKFVVGDRAQAVACIFDSGSEIEVSTGDVLREATVVALAGFDFLRVDGMWLVELSRTSETFDEGAEAECEAAL